LSTEELEAGENKRAAELGKKIRKARMDLGVINNSENL